MSTLECRLEDEELGDVPPFLSNHLRCAICAYVGVSWQLLPCAHSYCDFCAGSLVNSSKNTCPQCRKPFKREDLKPAFDRNSLAADLPVLCNATGRGYGCGWKGALDTRSGHVAVCGYQPEDCPHTGCSARPLRKDLALHIKDCKFRIVKCCYEGCLAGFQVQDEAAKAAHERECGKQPAVCDLCREEMKLENRQRHVETTCREAIVTCAGECRKDVDILVKSTLCDTANANGVLLVAAKEELEAATYFINMCNWEGKRGALSLHRSACVSYGMCRVVLPLQIQLLEKTKQIEQQKAALEDLRNQVKEQAAIIEKTRLDVLGKQETELCHLQQQVKAQAGTIRKQKDFLNKLQDNDVNHSKLINQQGTDITELQDETKEQATFVWDARYIDPKNYKPGDVVESPDFYLHGRKWRLELYPAGETKRVKQYAIYLFLLDTQKGESIEVRFELRHPDDESGESATNTYTSSSTGFGWPKFAQIPKEFEPIVVTIELLRG
eukprot:Rmarinus@m.23313